MNISKQSFNRYENIPNIARWKFSGALQSPKGRTLYAKVP